MSGDEASLLTTGQLAEVFLLAACGAFTGAIAGLLVMVHVYAPARQGGLPIAPPPRFDP